MSSPSIRDLNFEELKLKLKELNGELLNARFDKYQQKLSNVKLISNLKKDIARVKTFMREKEI